MWGFGGKYYWGRRDRGRGGIVVIFAWMSSEEKHLKHYIDLYASFGWDSLVCHSQFLNSFFPDKAMLLAWNVLNELVEVSAKLLSREVRIESRPIVFAAFSGGPKACLYKALQIIEGKCDLEYDVVCFCHGYYCCIRDCLAGHIYDSGPVDFVNDISMRSIFHPSILNVRRPTRLATWMANGIASGLDSLFLNRFESQRAEYWQTLFSSVSLKAPYLFLCSEDDDLAPIQTICNFAQQIQELGADVTLVKWVSSPHLGHYKHHSDDYREAVTQLLKNASTVYSRRVKQQFGYLKQVALSPSEVFKRASDELAEHFITPSTSTLDELRGSVVHLPSGPPSINPHGVLGEILFDICVPKNVDDWDIKPASSLHSPPWFHASRRQSHLNPIKPIRRSRIIWSLKKLNSKCQNLVVSEGQISSL
ncbi:hypothetical protein V2J09_007538 [Rumex salicifolius]